MHVDQHTKEVQKSYCKTVLAEHGQLTKELYDKINTGDEAAMRQVYAEQQQRIRERAESIADPMNKQLTLSQVDSIQEVLDALGEILNT